MTLGLGIEPGPHWWEASALTTAPSLLPLMKGEGMLVENFEFNPYRRLIWVWLKLLFDP